MVGGGGGDKKKNRTQGGVAEKMKLRLGPAKPIIISALAQGTGAEHKSKWARENRDTAHPQLGVSSLTICGATSLACQWKTLQLHLDGL